MTIRLSLLAVLATLSIGGIAAAQTGVTLPVVPRGYDTMQPKSPPIAQHLYVADMRGLPVDQQLLLASLQGIVNRTQPRIYLVWQDDDQFWLDDVRARGLTGAPIPVALPLSLLVTFRDSFDGAVVADPKVYETPCIAVDIAGLRNEVIATPELAERLGLPIKTDLRGRFKDDADALRYARTVLLPQMNPYLSLCLDPPILGSQVDDIIAERGSCFWVTGRLAQDKPGANEAAELVEIKKTFAAMPLGSIVRGFWFHGDGYGLDEGPGVALASRYGKITTVSDFVADFSVLSGITVDHLVQKAQPPAPALDKSKVYVAIAVSDGDNLCTWRGFFRNCFNDPLHGTFPIAWGMGPTMLDLAPTEAEWFYEHAAPTDEFICDVSGVGYMYPPRWGANLDDRQQALSTFYGWTQDYMKRMDMHTVRLMGVNAKAIAEVGADLPGVSFLMPDYGWSGEGANYSEYTYTLSTGQPVFRAITSSADPQSMADQIRVRVGSVRPAFCNVFVINWDLKLSDMRKMLDILGPGYVPVTPTQLNTLYREANPS